MKKIRPIIKWTGGKYTEFTLFSSYIPSFSRYIEPFFGGGGVFFALQPTTPALINDRSTDLINFYQTVQNKKLKGELLKYADAWDELTMASDEIWPAHAADYISYINDEIQQVTPALIHSLEIRIKTMNFFSDQEFVIDQALFLKTIVSSITDKARRIKNITLREGRLFSDEELKSHFETGIKSGAYLFFRKLLNQHYQQQRTLTLVKAVANWYFVREFCYGSMFRFNAKGAFNIPYGGIAYNRKKFRKKITAIFSKSVEQLFEEVSIFNLDFELFLKQIALCDTDFIFLDPPYDSEFSEYDQNSFTQHDQQRLAQCLFDTHAKWMVVIKETPFIRNLYTHKGVKINTFSKNYRYNVRGRNNRNVQHLIITNY